MPELQNAFNNLNSTCDNFDKRRMAAEKLILATDLNALQLTKDLNGTRDALESVNKGHEKVISMVLPKYMKSFTYNKCKC